MSVWGHAGARSRTPKVACISFVRPFFGTFLDSLFSVSVATHLRNKSQDAEDGSMDLSTGEQLGASARSRSLSPKATSHQPPTTSAVVVSGCDEMAIISGQLSERGGWDVRARALTCVALGRWVAFGPSEDERLGTRWCTEPDAQICMHFIRQTLFWYIFGFFLFCFISRSRLALTPPPARSPAPPLPVEHKYRVLAPGGYSIVASEVNLSQRTGCSLPLFALCVRTVEDRVHGRSIRECTHLSNVTVVLLLFVCGET